MIACSTCNMQKGNRTAAEFGFPNIQKQAEKHKSFRYSALSQSYKSYLMRELSKQWKVKKTYGAYTKFYRKLLGLDKSQVHDAKRFEPYEVGYKSRAIVSKGNIIQIPKKYILERQIKKRQPSHAYFVRNEYAVMHRLKRMNENKKGKPIVRTYANREVFGFKLGDKVRAYHSKKGLIIGYITGLRASGSFEIRNLEEDLLAGGITYKKLELIERPKTNYITEWRCLRNSPPPTTYRGLLAHFR